MVIIVLSVDDCYQRDPEMNNMKNVREFNALSPKWVVYITLFPSRFRDLCVRQGRKILSIRGGRLPQANCVFQAQ